MIKNIKQTLQYIQRIILFVRMEFKKNISLGVLSFLNTSQKGFFSISPILYNFKERNSEDFISDWKRLNNISKLNNKRRLVLDDKLIFHVMNKNNSNVKPIVAITKNNSLYKNNKEFDEIIVEKDLRNFLLNFENGLIIKPVTGGGGGHISKIHLVNNEIVFQGDCTTKKDFIEKVIKGKREFLLTEIIKQDGLCSEIYPHTLNTLRILTFIDPKSNKPFISRAVQRFGTKESNVVDNWTAGGISVAVDINDGTMGMGASYPKKNDLKVKWYKAHPDTKKTFYGCKIPHWELIKNLTLELSSSYSYLPYIGWDIVYTKDSIYVLEGNTNSDLNLLQIHGGLLTNVRNKVFYKHHNII